MITFASNAAAVAAMTRSLARTMPQAIRAALSKWAIASGTAVRSGAPRATGALKRSIKGGAVSTSGGPAAQIVAGMHYAPYLEFGTRRMRARRFFFDRIIARIPALRVLLADAMQRATNEAAARMR